MDVTIRHYYNPQAPSVPSIQRGVRNQAIKSAVDVNENRQPMGECRRSQEGLNLFSPLRELTGLQSSPIYMYRATT